MNKKFTLKEIQNNLIGLDNGEALDYLHSLEVKCKAAVERLIKKYEKNLEDLKKEQIRLYEMCTFERNAFDSGYRFVAGIDEAGRGPLAGPVVAAAVILPCNEYICDLDDSKKLTPGQRDDLYEIIIEKSVAYGIGIVDEKQIDKINILNATKKAMMEAVKNLKPQPDFLLLDAVELEDININQLSIIKGDSKSMSIAAASVLAKVTRDRLIEDMDSSYPQYGFKKHKGYGTKEHIEAIKKYGICPIHRVSFTRNFTI